MKRKSLSQIPWALFSPSKARPEELAFDVLDAHQRRLGQIVCTKFRMRFPSIDFAANTPWGEGRIQYTQEGPRIYMNDRETALMRSYMLKGKADFVFPDGTVMQFDKVKGKRNDIVYSGANGRVGFFEEQGSVTAGTTTQSIPMTREEIKALPKQDRPRSVETNDFVQFKIEVAGTLPTKEEDIVRALCMFACFGRLVEEIP